MENNCTHDDKVMQTEDGPMCEDCWYDILGAHVEENLIGGHQRPK